MSKPNLLSGLDVQTFLSSDGAGGIPDPAPAPGAEGGDPPAVAGEDPPAGDDPNPGDDPAAGGDPNAGNDPTPGDDPNAGDNPNAGAGAGDDPAGSGGEGSDDDDSFILELQQKLGYELDGEFSEDMDGLVGLTRAVGQKMAEDQLSQIFAAFPDVEEYMMYRINGGDGDKYFQTTQREIDYATIEIGEKDINTQKSIVRADLQSQGYQAKDVDDFIRDLEDSGILYKASKRSQTKLAAMQEQSKAQLLEQQQLQAQQQAEEAKKQWKSIQATINSGQIGNFTIPVKDQTKFFDWMAKPIDQQGRSARHIAREQLTQDQILAIEYLIYKGLDLEKIARANGATKQAKSLRAKLREASPTPGARMKGKSATARPTTLPSFREMIN